MPDNDPNDISLTTNDVLGIVQRMLAELNAYLSQHPNAVDRNVVLRYLDRMAMFASKIPGQQMQMAPNADESQQLAN